VRELTAVVPFWNGQSTIWRLLESLPAGLPVIIVDDHSDEAFSLEARPGGMPARDVAVIRPAERGYFSGAVNAGLSGCETDVLVLNQDVWFRGDGWLDELEVLRGRYDVIGDGVMTHPAWPKGYVQGTFMYVSREAIRRVGLLNESDYPLWGATCEYQLRACRRGFKAHPTTKFKTWMGHEPRPAGSKFGAAITEAIKRRPGSRPLFVRTPPAVSVVVPCHNYGRYLGDCFASLIGGKTCLGETEGQTFHSFEVIIVDDASTDGSDDVARAYADPWQGIRFIGHRRNRGTPYTLNTGVEAAVGEFVTILSADDMMEPWHLETLYRTCEANLRGIAYGDLCELKSGKRGRIHRLPDYDFESLLYKNPMSAGIMYPKRAWKEAGGYPKEMVHGREDWAFNIALGRRGWCGLHVGGRPGYLIRREKQNRSLTTATADWYRYFRDQLAGLYPELYAGERPMGCCGQRRGNVVGTRSRSVRTAKASTRREALVGADGMTLIVFQQDIGAPKTFYGPVTGAAYQFGGRRKVGRVDNKDLRTGQDNNPGFLEMYEHGRRLFLETTSAGAPPVKKVIQPPAAEPEGAEGVTAMSVSLTDEEEAAVAARIVEEETAALLTSAPDPGELSVKEIRELSGKLSADQWEIMLHQEIAGKNRSSAIAFMEAAIANLGG
jgi:GT2 family glycosyltransferase